MTFELNEEKVTDVLIWWVESADGSIDYREEQAVAEVLEDVDYSLDTFYQETMMHIGSLSNEHIQELIEDSLEWASTHFDHHRKQVTMALLEVIAESNEKISEAQQEKLDRIRSEFGLDK